MQLQRLIGLFHDDGPGKPLGRPWSGVKEGDAVKLAKGLKPSNAILERLPGYSFLWTLSEVATIARKLRPVIEAKEKNANCLC